MRYPAHLGLGFTQLGLEPCTASILERQGPSACPVDSVMGYGTATGEVRFGPEIISENGSIGVLRAADKNGHLAMLFFAEALDPVVVYLVLEGTLLPSPAPFGGHIELKIPLIPTLPEAPDGSVVQVHVTLGPAAGMYYEKTVHDRRVRYKPTGILLPDTCPRGGFPFAATFEFVDHSVAYAETRVPCPSRQYDHQVQAFNRVPGTSRRAR